MTLDDEDRKLMADLDISDPDEYVAFARSKNERNPDIYNDYLSRRQRGKAGKR